MSSPNQSGQNPNTAQTSHQSQPANTSAAGNTPSVTAGAGDTTTPNSNANGTAGGNAQPSNANANTVTFTPEQLAEIERRTNAAAAAARRETNEQAVRDRTRAEAEARGDVQTLLNTEQVEHERTRQELAIVRRELNALTVALEENLPRPTEVAPRLRGNTLDELRADARQFAGLLGNQVPRPTDPPATPSGGGTPQIVTPPANTGGGDSADTSSENLTDDDIGAELRSGLFSSLG